MRAVLTSGSGEAEGGKGRRRVEQLGDPLLHRRLVVLHVQDVLRPILGKGFGDFRLTEHGVAGDDLALHRGDAQEGQRRLVLVRLGVDADLPDHRLHRRGEQRHQMHRRHVPVVGAAEGFAVEGEVLAQIGTALENPVPRDAFEGVDVEASEDAGVGGHARRLPPAEAERESEGLAVIATELSDPLEGGSPGQHGDHRQTQHGREVVHLALPLPRVVNAVEHLGQRAGHGETSGGGLHSPHPPILANLNSEKALPLRLPAAYHYSAGCVTADS